MQRNIHNENSKKKKKKRINTQITETEQVAVRSALLDFLCINFELFSSFVFSVAVVLVKVVKLHSFIACLMLPPCGQTNEYPLPTLCNVSAVCL